MRSTTGIFTLAVLAMSFLLAGPMEAQARYLDPGTGTMIIQVVVAALATILLFFRSAWMNVKMTFLKLIGKAPDLED